MRSSYVALPILFGTLLAGLAVISAPRIAEAGPWVKPAGETYTKLSVGRFQATGVFDEEGNLNENPEYDYAQTALRLYSEIGLFEHFSAGFKVPVLRAANETDVAIYRKTGFGNLDLFVQGGTNLGTCSLSGRLTTQVPLYPDGVGEDSGPVSGGSGENELVPVLGDGSVNVTPKASFGCGLGILSGWFSLEAGPQIRFSGFGEGLDYGAELGVFLFPSLAVKGHVGGIQRFSSDNEMPTKSYVNILGSAIFKVTDTVGVEATGGYIPTGAFVSRGWNVSIGVSYDGPIWSD